MMNRLVLSSSYPTNILLLRRAAPRIGQQTVFNGCRQLQRKQQQQDCYRFASSAGAPFPTTTTTTTTTNETDDAASSCSSSSLSSIRTRILQLALEEVHQYGWTEEALSAATASVLAAQQQQQSSSSSSSSSISMSIVGMISVDELISFCMDQWNIQLQQDLLLLKKESSSSLSSSSPNNNNTMDMDVEDPIEYGIRLRLKYLIPYLQSSRWHEGMALGIRGPKNAIQTQKQLKEMIDIIIVATTSSTTTTTTNSTLGTPERMALGAVYVATELHLLTDKSNNYEETWNFLNQRMQDWYRICSLLGSAAAATTTSRTFSSSPLGGGIGGGAAGGAGDALFVVSSVASSLMGGLVSLVMPPNNSSSSSSTAGGLFGLPEAVWTSLFQNPSSSSSQWDGQRSSSSSSSSSVGRGGRGGPGDDGSGGRAPGTHPDDYNVPKK